MAAGSFDRKISSISLITDAALRDKVQAAHTRGASDGEIAAIIKTYALDSELRTIPQDNRIAFLAELKNAGCPAPFFPIAERLVRIGRGHGGEFVVCGFGEDPQTDRALSSQLVRIQNKGEPTFIYRQFGSAIRRLSKTRGLNIYMAPALVRDGLPEGLRGKETDIIGVLAVVVDFDAKNDPASRHKRLPVAPHAEVETSSGNFQCWYFLDKPYGVVDAKPVIVALVENSGGDPGCKSADHPFRVPGTLNWPNAKKQAQGRPKIAVMARLADAPEDALGDQTSLYDLKTAMVARWPNAFDAAQSGASTVADFDWDQRRNFLNAFDEATTKGKLNNEKHSDDRSVGAWAFINSAERHGHSPNEIVHMLLDHPEALHVGHYGSPPDENRIRADVQRAFKKNRVILSAAEVPGSAGSRSADIFGAMPAQIDGMDADAWHGEMNRHFAVVKYGGQIVVAQTGSDKLEFVKLDDFHRMFANKFITLQTSKGDRKSVPISKSWFIWEGRRQYLDPGVVFEPGAHDRPGMLNLWRGFGVTPKPGDWSHMEAHILECVCHGKTDRFDYLMKWMAHGVQHPDRPSGVAVALRGAQGAGKGILFRTYGSFFGQHFVHLSQGGQLTGRFNANLGMACAVFLDEALWAGDRQGEGTLKALITEPTFQLERKFCDPITVPNRLRIMIASNSDWFVPVGVGDRRYFVLDVADTYAGVGHKDYWAALHTELDTGGKEAMLHHLLAMDLSDFDIRTVPDTAARTEQKLRSLRGTRAWLLQVLQEGAIGTPHWKDDGLVTDKDAAYHHYVAFSKDQREWQPEQKTVWAKTLRKVLGDCVKDARPREGGTRQRMLAFGRLDSCRTAFRISIGAQNEEPMWEERG